MNQHVILNVIIEIPKNSNIKYEYNRKTKQISVDRILYGSEHYPENYGFIENTLDYDGDELDALVISDQSFFPGVSVPMLLIGAMEMIDDGEIDTKLIGVISCDKRYAEIQNITDLAQHRLDVIKNFFESYKTLQKKQVIVKGFKSAEWAMKEFNDCKDLYNKYANLPKEEFLVKAKKLFPDKYLK